MKQEAKTRKTADLQPAKRPERSTKATAVFFFFATETSAKTSERFTASRHQPIMSRPLFLPIRFVLLLQQRPHALATGQQQYKQQSAKLTGAGTKEAPHTARTRLDNLRILSISQFKSWTLNCNSI